MTDLQDDWATALFAEHRRERAILALANALREANDIADMVQAEKFSSDWPGPDWLRLSSWQWHIELRVESLQVELMKAVNRG